MTPNEIALDVVMKFTWLNDTEWVGFIAEAICAEREAVLRALGPGSRFMDPPDGGDPTPAEQVANMRAQLDVAEAERDKLREAALTAQAWLDRWAVHVGSCRGRESCQCGLTRVRWEVDNTLSSLRSAEAEPGPPSR